MPTTSSFHKSQNQILAALPATIFNRLTPEMDLVTLESGETLHEQGKALEYIYFPTTALISLQSGLTDGTSVELAGIGREGMLDVSLYSASRQTFARAIVQLTGHSYRIKTSLMLLEMGQSGQMLQHFLRYTGSLIRQISLSTACHRYHSTEQQICRWILLALDRASSSELPVSLDGISTLLGVCQEDIKKTSWVLESAECIVCHRDHITVIDRSGLEARVCECYGVARHEVITPVEDLKAL